MNDTSEPVPDSEVSKYVILLFMCLVNCTAIVGNVSIIIVVLRCFQLRHTLTNFFVLNLSVVDFLASVTTLPVSISSFVYKSWSFDSMWCVVSAFISSFSMYASICNLCFISIERYYSIKLPMHHAAHMTLHKTVGAISFIWIQSFVLATLPLLGVNSYTYQIYKKYCSFTWEGSRTDRAYVLFISVWCFVVPSIILLMVHCGIFRVARDAARQIRPYPSTPAVSIVLTETQPERLRENTKKFNRLPGTCIKICSACFSVDDHVVHVAERSMSAHMFQHTPRPNKGHFKAIKTLITIFSSFVILWGPYFILNAHGAIYRNVAQRETTELLVLWLGYTSFAVNPLLYGWMNRAIRQELTSCYHSTFCCFYRADSRLGPSEGPRDGEDFIQFLERTSYNACSSNPLPRTANNSEHGKIMINEPTCRDPFNNYNADRTNEHVKTKRTERLTNENFETESERRRSEHIKSEHSVRIMSEYVNGDRATTEYIKSTNGELTPRERVEIENNEQYKMCKQ